MRVEPCPLEDRPEALAVLYRRVPDSLRPRLIQDALNDAVRGEIDLSGLWVARKREKIVGALLTQILGGRAAAVWAPEVALPLWSRGGAAAHLLRTVLASLGQRGIIVAQALVNDSSGNQAAGDLTRGGMPKVTELVSLERSTDLPLIPLPGVPEVQWLRYDETNHDNFCRVLAQTYKGSLDMPELEGIRSLDDVVAGHKEGGRFRPELWHLGTAQGEDSPSIILLLSEVPERQIWEVAYLGLTPQARGRGLGRASLAFAIKEARKYVGKIELAVDVRNIPAAKLYESAGFTPFDRRTVHLARLIAKP